MAGKANFVDWSAVFNIWVGQVWRVLAANLAVFVFLAYVPQFLMPIIHKTVTDMLRYEEKSSMSLLIGFEVIVTRGREGKASWTGIRGSGSSPRTRRQSRVSSARTNGSPGLFSSAYGGRRPGACCWFRQPRSLAALPPLWPAIPTRRITPTCCIRCS
jgi:hypothetical protein